MMKNKLKVYAFLAGASLLVPGCKDEADKPQEQDLQQIIELQQPTMPELLPTEEPAQPAAAGEAMPGEAEVRAQLLPMLADFPSVKLEQLRMDTTQADEGSVVVTARVQVSVGEDLYIREDAPEVFNEERKAMNDAANRAMLPESHYLLLVGTPTEDISDQDRLMTPLPEELQKMAEELKHMAEGSIYHLRVPARTHMEMPASMRAAKRDGHWVFSEVSLDTAPLHTIVAAIPESALPQGAAVVNDGFEAQQRLALREKVNAFNQAAEPYIQGREEAARKRMLELQARREEEAKAAEELIAKKAAAHGAWEKICAAFLHNGSVFEGEWKRGDAFGKISLRMARTQTFPESVQFIGVIFDPDMMQSELQVVGRCEEPAHPGEPAIVTVHIYNGRYDPDVATAEVFDAKDALMRLQLAEDGALKGELTCESWKDSPEKAFHVALAYVSKRGGRRAPARPRSAAPAPTPAPAPAAPAS